MRVIYLVQLMALSISAFAGVHRYEMEPPLLQIYPANLKMTQQQRHSALHALANDMQARGGGDLVGFVQIALYEMAALYEDEARRSGASEAGKSLSYRWTDTTMTYANTLYRAAAAITADTSIDISTDATGELMIIIDSKPYLLSSPALNKPLLLDEKIIDRVCQEISCNLETVAIEESATKRVIVINADWIISPDQPPEYVTDNGLHFVFRDLRNRPAKQIACLKVIKEMELLAGTLRDAVTRGVSIDQDQLYIHALYGSYDYRVRLNRFGDTIYIKLPELHHVPDWITQLWPWLHARMEGRIMDHYLQADDMLAYTLK